MPDSIAAPYITASEINSQPGDANLSGAAVNFDPSVKAPYQPIQDTFNRVDAEAFQRQEQLRRQKHDLLTKQMDYDQQWKVLKQQQAWKEHQNMIDFFNSTDNTVSTLKGPDGKNMSIAYLPKDQQQLNDETHNFRKKVMADGWTEANLSPYFDQTNQELKQKRVNASMRGVYAAKAKQDLAGAYLPEQKQKINDYLDYLDKTPLDAITPPSPYISQPTWEATPQVDVSKYREKKDLETFDAGLGVPKRVYAGFETTQDPALLNQGYGNYQHFINTPQGQDPAVYKEFQDNFNDLRKARGEKPIDFGANVNREGKMVFDESTPNKRIALARKFLTAYNEMQTGHLQDNPDKEEDEQKLKKLKAETNRVYAETGKTLIEKAIKEKELEFGKDTKPTAEELKQQQTVKAVKSMYSSVQSVFDDTKNKFTPAYPAIWKRLGVSPEDYEVYNVPKNSADKFIGLEADQVTTKTKNAGEDKEETTEHTIKGESQKADNVWLVKNIKTGNKELVYVKDQKVLTRVPEKEAIINGLKHEAKYDPARYDNKVAWVEDIYDKTNKEQLVNDNPQPANSAKINTPPPTIVNSVESTPKLDISDKISKVESDGDYTAINENTGALGKYQFLPSYHWKKIKEITGVKNEQEFLQNPEAQETYFKWNLKNNINPALNNIKKYNKDGYDEDQLRMLIHFKGENGAKDWLQGKKDSTGKNNMEIEDYIGSPASSPESNNDETTIRARLVPITIKRKDGSLVKAKKDPVTGKRYSADE